MFRFLAALAFTLTLLTHAHAAPPNVVLIVGDDQGSADYGFLGHEHIKTPHLDKLASEGLLFKRGYVPSSLCRASLATMITGLYPHQHLITSNDPPTPKGLTLAQANKDPGYLKQRQEMVALFEKSPTLPKLLEKEGYVSFQAGKWWEGNSCRCGGFTEGMTHGDPSKGGRHGDAGLTTGREGLQPVFDFLDKAKKDEKPFFVWYAPMMPHLPHTPPERLLNKYKDKTKSIHVARYWAMCEWFDETIGDLLAKLAKNGQSENTLVIYLHDNGWIQDPNTPNFAPRSKRSQYDGGLRTPIIVKWPGHVKPSVSDSLASSIDLAPTILAAVGAKPTKGMDGINLLDPHWVASRSTLFGEIYEHTAVDITKPVANLQYRWMVDGNWKLILPFDTNVKDSKPELFDLSRDPGETMDLATKHADKVAELSKKLDAWWKPTVVDPKLPAIFARDNLVAWCIVPFDAKKRSPEDRAAMMKKLGFKKFAYDWRSEHLPTFEREIAALKKEGIELTAVWFPAGLNADAKVLLDALKKHEIKTQLWITMGGGGPAKTPEEQAKKVQDHANAIKPIAEAADKIGCTVALYNHGSWFGEPENQIAIIEELKLKNVGIVYNLHHGHDHLDRMPELLKKMKPHLLAFNLNGMIPDGERKGKKIIPLGQGSEDLKLMKLLADSGWSGPVGILGHTSDDAEERLKDNLDGLDWLLPQLSGKEPGPKPTPKTYKVSVAPAVVPTFGWLAEGK